MIKISNNLFLLFVLAVISLQLNAQKIITTTGTAQVKVEGNITEDETYEIVEQLAKIDAIQKEFGTYTEQQMDMTIKDGMTSYHTIGTTKVKGDWIETTNIKFSENIKKDKTELGIRSTKYVTCEIKGKVRKSMPRASLQYEILNRPDLLSRTHSFYHDEQLYVFFKSPVKGLFSIFLEDDEAVYRLLPYVNMSDDYQSGVPIKSDTDYLFFSPNNNAFPGNSVDEQQLLSLNADIEYNYIYIVFSEDKYIKPMLENSKVVNERIIPKQLTKKRFQQWLANNRASSESFQDIKIKVSIEQKE